MRNYRIQVLLQQRFNDIIFTTPIVIFITKFINFAHRLCGNSSACLTAGKLVERPDKSGPRLMLQVLKFIDINSNHY